MGKDDRNKVFSQLFRPKVFDMDLPQKVFYGVSEHPLLRNAQKRHKKEKKKREKGTYLPHLVAICQIYVAFKKLFLRRPLDASRSKEQKRGGTCVPTPPPPPLLPRATKITKVIKKKRSISSLDLLRSARSPYGIPRTARASRF
jgi:hypothetical protein